MSLNLKALEEKRYFIPFSIFILSVSYAFLGYSSLFLALPPGYINAISPATGLAVAVILIWGNQLWLGVFLGSALLNIVIGLQHDSLTTTKISIALIIATGATLQALTSAWLVRRYISFPIALTEEKEIFFFMILSGPAACIISASIGVTSLYLTQSIPLSEFIFSWFTWWVGDSIGVLITVPLFFIIFGHPKELWISRRIVVTIPLVFILTSVIALYTWASKLESERIQYDFKEISHHTHERLISSFASYLDSVASIERLYLSNGEVSRKEFSIFVDNDLANKRGINGLSWNPVITNDQRHLFEESVKTEGFDNFSITERNNEGTLINAALRDEYIVVSYIEPLDKNRKALGFDVGSNPIRLQALHQARDTGLPIATAKITLVQEKGEQSGILLFHPVYSGPHDSQSKRRENIRGFAVGVFRIGDIVDTVLDNQFKEQLTIAIYDQSDGDNTKLYGPDNSATVDGAPFNFQKTLVIGGREWSVHFWPTDTYLASQDVWQAWGVLLIGLLFCGILCALLLAMTGRSYYLDREVKARTRDLESSRNNLILTNKTLESSNIQLERTNIELDQYAFVASHDLKSPLQAIKQLASWIEEDCHNILPDESLRHLKTLKKRIDRMENLLSDLLAFSRISKEDYDIEDVNLETLVKKSMFFNAVPDSFKLTTVSCDTQINAPRVPLELALRNLIGNAVKHHDKDHGNIRVNYSLEQGYHIIQVSDDGPGIDPKLQKKAVEMFQTLKSRDEIEGSGLGLSVVKKSVERINGTMNIISDGLRGTTIELRWPMT